VTLGERGERLAAKFLKRIGYTILARNYTCPVGEIDLIARDGDSIVFVEVKTRASDADADPENNVTYAKRRRLTRAAKYFVMRRRAQDAPCRFDVVAAVLPPDGKGVIEHFPDAFAPAGRQPGQRRRQGRALHSVQHQPPEPARSGTRVPTRGAVAVACGPMLLIWEAG
jgi:putative endonuclease